MVFRPLLTPVWMRIIRFTHNRDFMYVVSLGVVCMCVWVGGWVWAAAGRLWGWCPSFIHMDDALNVI